MFISSVLALLQGYLQFFAILMHAIVNPSPTLGDFAMLKIIFVQAPPCLTCAARAHGSLLTLSMGTGQIGHSAGFSFGVWLMGICLHLARLQLGDQVGLRTQKSFFALLLLTVKTVVCILWIFIKSALHAFFIVFVVDFITMDWSKKNTE